MNDDEVSKTLSKKLNIATIIFICIFAFFMWYENNEKERELKQKQQYIEQMETEIKYQLINEYLNEN